MKRMLKKYSLLSFFVGGFLALCNLESCNLINPPETIPCYGKLNNISVKTNYGTQGTASADISCAWVYVDDQAIGTFELPCKFPMIAGTGTHTVTVIPGITADGTPSTREKYTFLTDLDTTVTLTQGAVTTFTFTATYKSGVQFDWLEDFEGPSPYITSITKDTQYYKDTNQMYKIGLPLAFEGNHSGQVLLDSVRQLDSVMIWEAFTDTMSLPHDGSSVFLEMNYNTNNIFTVGVCCNSLSNLSFYTGLQETSFVVVNPSYAWKKMYIDLTPALANQAGGLFRIIFYMTRQKGNQARLLLDNLKVLHFKGS